MSNSVVSAARQPKQLVRNKKLIKRTEDQKLAHDEKAVDKDADAAHVVKVGDAHHDQSAMSDTSMSSGFSFGGALSDAAGSASLAAQSDPATAGTSTYETEDDSDGDGVGGIDSTVLLIGAVAAAGLGIAAAVSGGGSDDDDDAPLVPVFSSGATATVAENVATTTVVYDANLSTGGTAAFALTGADAGAFNIDPATGVVTFKASPDFEAKSTYAIGVTATVAGASATQNVTVTVTDVAEAVKPVFSNTSNTATVDENVATSTVVYDANLSTPGTAAFTLTGADAGAFNIDSTTGVVTFKTSPDFETKSSYAIGVVATVGGLATTQNVTVNVNNLNDIAPSFTSGTGATATVTIAENAPTTTVVYDANVSGAFATTFALTGADAALFNIDSNTGVVTLKTPADFETKPNYAFNVTATSGGQTSAQAVTVNVTDVAEATNPVFTSGTTASIAENSPVTTPVYDANVSGTAATTFALTGADAAAFNIDSATGVVTFKASPDFETRSNYAIGVVATSAGLSTTQNVAVSVTDVVAEAPTFVSGTTVSFAENTPTSNVVYDANANGSGTITYSLTGDDADEFTINATTGEVRFVTSPNFELDNSYALSVVATNGNGSTTQNVAISITDVVETGPSMLSLDIGNPASSTPTVRDAGPAAFELTEDAGVNTNVNILNFTSDDIITVTGVDDLDDYSFTTGTGTNETDLIITLQNAAEGIANIILIEDVLNGGFVVDYETASAAVGFDFMQLG